MNIVSLVLRIHPETRAEAEAALTAYPGVECHGMSDDGKLVVTIETETDGETTSTYDRIGQMDGVMSVAMVFHQFESDPDIEVPAQAGHEVTPELNGGSK